MGFPVVSSLNLSQPKSHFIFWKDGSVYWNPVLFFTIFHRWLKARVIFVLNPELRSRKFFAKNYKSIPSMGFPVVSSLHLSQPKSHFIFCIDCSVDWTPVLFFTIFHGWVDCTPVLFLFKTRSYDPANFLQIVNPGLQIVNPGYARSDGFCVEIKFTFQHLHRWNLIHLSISVPIIWTAANVKIKLTSETSLRRILYALHRVSL